MGSAKNGIVAGTIGIGKGIDATGRGANEVEVLPEVWA